VARMSTASSVPVLRGDGDDPRASQRQALPLAVTAKKGRLGSNARSMPLPRRDGDYPPRTAGSDPEYVCSFAGGSL
jgi:hypothetical protein